MQGLTTTPSLLLSSPQLTTTPSRLLSSPQESIARLVAGEDLGTVFLDHRSAMASNLAAEIAQSRQPSAQAQAQSARAAARALQLLSYQERVHILKAMADALEEHVHEIVAANQARAVDCH
jgi:acyl-CoA reductase-like NAD-dependent aldehyde dehydrogenase